MALSAVYNWLLHRKFGVSQSNASIDAIVDSFYERTNCGEVNSCKVYDPCTDERFVICNLTIGSITVEEFTLEGDVTLSIPIENNTNPTNVQWTFDATLFDLVSGQGTPTLKLKVKNYISINTNVFVTVTDSFECTDNTSGFVLIPYALLDCEGIFMFPNGLFSEIPYVGTLTIPYSGGNGGSYEEIVIQSTGVEGLTATLPQGQFVTGDDVLEFILEGTPESVGDAVFEFNLMGQSCVFEVPVADTTCASPSLSTNIGDFDSLLNGYPVTISWVVLGNAQHYNFEYEIEGTPMPPEVIDPPANSFTFMVPPTLSFSGSVTTDCVGDILSEPSDFEGSVPDPGECLSIDVDTVETTIGLYNVTTDQYEVTIEWDPVPNTVNYEVIRLSDSSVVFTTTPSVVVSIPSSTDNEIFIIKGHCTGGVGSLGTFITVDTPSAPFPPGPELPVFHILDNVGTPDEHLRVWMTIDSSYVKARIFQADLFSTTYTADSGNLTKGVSNGYLPLPVGFGPDDIYFDATVSPTGHVITGNDVTKLKIELSSTNFTYNFYYIMNVSQAYTVRQDTLDYIPTNDGDTRPVLSFGSVGPGTVTVNFAPNTFNYDACSSFNMFAVSSTGAITTATPGSYSPSVTSYTFTGLTPGQYYIFFEMTYDNCTSPATYVTAIPIGVTIP